MPLSLGVEVDRPCVYNFRYSAEEPCYRNPAAKNVRAEHLLWSDEARVESLKSGREHNLKVAMELASRMRARQAPPPMWRPGASRDQQNNSARQMRLEIERQWRDAKHKSYESPHMALDIREPPMTFVQPNGWAGQDAWAQIDQDLQAQAPQPIHAGSYYRL